MNLDGVGAPIVLDLGFPWQSTRMFLLTPRTVSIGAHYLEERRRLGDLRIHDHVIMGNGTHAWVSLAKRGLL
jgi:citrate synthase